MWNRWPDCENESCNKVFYAESDFSLLRRENCLSDRLGKEMSRVNATFQSLAKRGEKALIAYVMAGDPSLDKTEEIVLALEHAGVDLVELGIPFSDPVADGPTIQKAAERALRGKVSLRMVMERVRKIRQKTEIPLILMTYMNPILRIGPEPFVATAGQSGIDGVIVPDLPIEEGEGFASIARREGVDLIFLAAPTTGVSRLKKIVRLSSGFLYYISITGITGAPLKEVSDVQKRVKMIKSIAPLPVVVGFGISTPEEAKGLGQVADGVVVGSAIVKIIERYHQDVQLLSSLQIFVRALKEALRTH